MDRCRKNMSCRGAMIVENSEHLVWKSLIEEETIPNAVLMKSMISCQLNFFNCKRQTYGYLAFVNSFVREFFWEGGGGVQTELDNILRLGNI